MNILLLFGVFFVLIMLSADRRRSGRGHIADHLPDQQHWPCDGGPESVYWSGLLYADRHSLLHVGGQFDGSGRYRQTYRQSCRRRGG